MSDNNKLQSAEFCFAGETFCLMRQSVDVDEYILYMEEGGKWAEMNWRSFFEDGDIETMNMIETITSEIIQLDLWLADSQMPSKPFAYYEEGHIYTFHQCKNQIVVEVEASSFDDASNIMFGDGEYDPNDWKLVLIDRAPIAHV
ncbi:hypothetical protein [Synechococcus sp. MIT S9503]|uniref:hypothetical protein n=1 Tax=Synechococcus sp. MIT S9503 TaxID=3082547 RepID=UPI0039A635F4